MKSVYTYLFIIDFSITNPDCDRLVEFQTNLVKHLLHCPWDDTPLLVIVGKSKHGECLSWTSLSITHDSAVVASNHIGHDLCWGKVKHIILGCIEHNVVERKLPVIELIVNCAFIFLVNVDIEILKKENKCKDNSLLFIVFKKVNQSYNPQNPQLLTPVYELILRLLEANWSVGLVLMYTYTAYFELVVIFIFVLFLQLIFNLNW